MNFPKYKIEIYNTSNVLIHTLEPDKGAEVLSIHTMETLNAVGSFNFTVTNGPAGVYPLSGVRENWRVKIYGGNNTASTLLSYGKIKKITSALDDNGYIRGFEGKNRTEILERRQKTNKMYQAEHADHIPSQVCSDLSLSSSSTADTNPFSHLIRTETYLDLMKAVSDYWVSAGTQLKKDFYIDATDTLIWKNRPLRTAGVSTLTLGNNILSYNVIRDALVVRNNITVYGAARSAVPINKDDYTDSLTNWTAIAGTLSLDATAPPAGTYWIRCDTDGASLCNIYRIFNESINIRDINNVSFYLAIGLGISSIHVKLLAPDSSNYYQSHIGVIGTGSGSTFYTLPLGPESEYIAVENPNGSWDASGSPNWWNIQGIAFYAQYVSGAAAILIDKMFFHPYRFSSSVHDDTSIAAYDQQDAEFTDNNLTSNAECEVRAQTLLYQLKDPITRVDLQCEGDVNLLIGDRLPLTIPAEEISAVNFDIVASEHNFVPAKENAWTTTIRTVDSGNIRVLPSASHGEAVNNQIKNLKLVTTDLYSRIVK
jgi:hypothetical protein